MEIIQIQKRASLTQLTIPDKFRNSNRDIEERGGAPLRKAACGTSISKRQMRRPSSLSIGGKGGGVVEEQRREEQNWRIQTLFFPIVKFCRVSK